MNKDHTILGGKTCLVTGANAGIGRETCLALAHMGAEVIMSARNQSQAEKVKTEIIKTTGNPKIHLIAADLSDPNEVVKLSNEVKDRWVKLDVLVNNAGIFLTEYQENQLGIEIQWMVNHLAPFILTRRLLHLLQLAPESRIINVSSNAHLNGQIDFEDLNGKQKYRGFKAYSQSKLANVLFTKELAARLRGTHVSSFAMHPGVVKTNIGNKNNDSWMSWAWSLGKPFMITARKGSKTILYLASAPQLRGLSGLYFVKNHPHPSSESSMNTDLSSKLWQVSEDMVKDYVD